MKKYKGMFFLKLKNGKIENQGRITKVTKLSLEGYFFNWTFGERGDDFVAAHSFIDNCIVFDSDHEMRFFAEHPPIDPVYATEVNKRQAVSV